VRFSTRNLPLPFPPLLLRPSLLTQQSTVKRSPAGDMNDSLSVSCTYNDKGQGEF